MISTLPLTLSPLEHHGNVFNITRTSGLSAQRTFWPARLAEIHFFLILDERKPQRVLVTFQVKSRTFGMLLIFWPGRSSRLCHRPLQTASAHQPLCCISGEQVRRNLLLPTSCLFPKKNPKWPFPGLHSLEGLQICFLQMQILPHCSPLEDPTMAPHCLRD